MTSAISFAIVLISFLVFAAVLVFALFHALFERYGSGAVNNEPLIKMSEPNRRNQSAAPSSRRKGRYGDFTSAAACGNP